MSVVWGCPLETSNFSKQILGGDVGGEGDGMKSHCFNSVVSANIFWLTKQHLLLPLKV